MQEHIRIGLENRMRKISAVKAIKCPICHKRIEAGDLRYHAEREVKEYTVKQSVANIMKLCKSTKGCLTGIDLD